VEGYGAELDRQAKTLQNGPDLDELRRRWQAKGLGPLP
jgi:hypothetical protein